MWNQGEHFSEDLGEKAEVDKNNTAASSAWMIEEVNLSQTITKSQIIM